MRHLNALSIGAGCSIPCFLFIDASSQHELFHTDYYTQYFIERKTQEMFFVVETLQGTGLSILGLVSSCHTLTL